MRSGNCKSSTRNQRGSQWGTKLSLINKININIACAHTKKIINNKCFAGGNKTHMDQENDAFKSSVNCRGLLNGLK
ncbi:hypothetical protein [Salmonella enterica]|uniref:hypothetical protein n=1 Tax=Salmonella enterica TaxID=28901 RepID=UPI000DBE3945|nr:hypothetical protein [Salmonella enterica]ECF6029109.1 hypothetical protein [Salmonella enterica subsp. salamae serovar Greenside]ECJ2543268.1 hypothetical protein [Salmonella enterica subsp. salamae]